MLWSCGGLPLIRPAEAEPAARITSSCLSLFPEGAWTVVHAIEATMPLGHRTAIIGVSRRHVENDTLSSVLMAPEGVIFFAGRDQGGEIHVDRALPPLDDAEFATRLFRDVRLMFLPPPGAPTEAGTTGAGLATCRWHLGADRYLDVVLEEEGGWQVVEYGPGGEVSRRMAATRPGKQGFSQLTRLSVAGSAGYRMRFQLLEVQ